MALTPIEVIAGLLVVISFIKIFVVIIRRSFWYEKVVEPVYAHNRITSIVFVILAVIVFSYLIKELTIVQIFAVMAFVFLLSGLGFLMYSKELIPFIEKIYSKRLGFFEVVYIIAWFLLLIWAFKEIFLT